MTTKKSTILYVLDILHNYSDKDHRLTQKEIVDLLYETHQIDLDRRTVKQRILELIEYGYDIETSGGFSNIYLRKDITDGELRLLIESLMFSKRIPYSYRQELIEKLEDLSGEYFHAKPMETTRDQHKDQAHLENFSLFITLRVLEKAIKEAKKVCFNYNHYGVDEHLAFTFTPKMNNDGEASTYLMNPYEIVSTNGRYYLICNYDTYDDLSNYRIDRITNIKILDEPRKPKHKVKGLGGGLDVSKHMEEHIYMFSGASEYVTLSFEKNFINEFVDWFGTKNSRFIDQNDEKVTAEVKVNRQAMTKWALQYALHARVLTPADLVEEIKDNIKEAKKMYK